MNHDLVEKNIGLMVVLIIAVISLGGLAGLETSSTITLTPRLAGDLQVGVLLQQPGAVEIHVAETDFIRHGAYSRPSRIESTSSVVRFS